MHELSIATHLVEIAVEAAEEAGVGRVDVVHLRLGALSGVVKEALLFCYELAAEGTLLAGSQLDIEDVPLTLSCRSCGAETQLAIGQAFVCPHCTATSLEILTGKELEIVSLECGDLAGAVAR
jgi:hydrogenase nickel incorporation protein HypA/HybF